MGVLSPAIHHEWALEGSVPIAARAAAYGTVVSTECLGRCPPDTLYANHVHFSVAGLQQGYVVVSPVHPKPDASRRVVHIPVTLNGG